MSLQNDLLKLAEIDYKLNRLIKDKGFLEEEQKRKLFFDETAKFIHLKRRIKSGFAKKSAIIIEDFKTRELLQKISNDEQFIADIIIQSFEEMTGEEFDVYKLDWDELENIVSDELYSWFGPYEYIERLIEIGTLIIGLSIPKSLSYFISEARQSYAFQNFNAVYSLCRTILETSMRDVCIRMGKIQRPKDDKEFYKEYPPRKLINTVSRGSLRGKIHSLYGELSSLIHGYKTVNEETAKHALQETLIITQELYNKILDN